MTKRCRLGGVLKRMQGQGQGLLLLAHLLTLSYVEFCIDAELIDNPSGSTMGAPVSSQSVRWSPVAHFEITTETSGPLMPTNALPMHKGHTEHLSTESSSSRQTFSPAQAPDYGSLVAVGHASLSSSHISIASLKQNRRSSHNPGLSRPPTLEASPPGIADGSMPPASAQAPEPPSISGCCGPNMVQRRGSLDCHCVYPIKVELYLWNVSLSSNWRDEFLDELASQLNLRVSQFEIENFYVVGTSGLNITMDVTPHTGISFSANEASAVNNSLTYHSVRIDPSLVGSYKLLNLTHFMPPPSPAPASAASPNSLPHLSSPVHKSSNEHGSNKLANIILVLGICAGAAIITSVMTICYCKSDRGKKAMPEDMAKAPSVDVISMEGSFAHPSSTRFLAYEELKEATNNFEASSMLGEGGFGRVFRGVLADGTAVAIKKLTSGGHQGDKEFLVEVQMLSRLHHRNLVKLIGYYTSRESSQNLLCYELVPNGSLEAWLHGPLGVNCPLDWDTRMKIALDAARGLAYLHEDSQPCVIHRDFKASNILLENDFHAKVSDFGLAKHAPEGRTNHLSTRVMGTFGYVAPEYAMTGHLLVKSDVYSYGVVLLELLTGKKPVDMSQPSGQENLVAWARPILRDREHINDLADPRLNGKCPKEDFVRVCIIAAACVAPEASQRPTMGEVVQSLKMVQHATEYQDSTSTSATARPNIRPSSSAYESDGFSSMFSSGPFSGLSLLDNDNVSRTAMFSEDLHEGR